MPQLAPTPYDTLSSQSIDPAADPPPSRRCVAAIFALVVGLCLIGIADMWWPTPDSALYMSLARSIQRGDGYQFNGAGCNMVPPGFPVLLVGLFELTGQAYWAANALVALCAAGLLWLMYAVLGRLYDKWTALLTMLVVGMSYRFYENGHRILSDIPATFTIWLMLYAALRFQAGRIWWLVIAGVASAASIILRIPSGIIVGPIALGIALDRPAGGKVGRRLLASGVILAAATATWAAWMAAAKSLASTSAGYTNVIRPDMLSTDYWLGELGDAARNLPGALAEMLTGQELTWIIGAPCLVLAAAGMVSAWRRGRRVVAVTVITWALATLVATGAWAFRERYMIPLFALLVASIFEGVRTVVAWFARQKPLFVRIRVANIIVIIMAVMFATANAPRTLKWSLYYTYRAHTGGYYKTIARGKHKELLPAAEAAAQYTGLDQRIAVVGVKISTMHFLADRVIVQAEPLEKDSAYSTIEMTGQLFHRSDVTCVAVDLRKAKTLFVEKFAKLAQDLVDGGKWRLIFDGEAYQVYSRVETISSR